MFGFVSKKKYEAAKREASGWRAFYLKTERELHNLRNNSFLTNERGHRVKYHNASAEVRAKAEGLS